MDEPFDNGFVLFYFCFIFNSSIQFRGFAAYLIDGNELEPFENGFVCLLFSSKLYFQFPIAIVFTGDFRSQTLRRRPMGKNSMRSRSQMGKSVLSSANCYKSSHYIFIFRGFGEIEEFAKGYEMWISGYLSIL
jgi:hypothetical protein